LLVLAGGTGNSLARDLGLTRLDSALTAARENRRRTLDLIRITFHSAGQPFSRLAISTASVGYAAEVVVIANRYFKSLGPLCYPLAATLQAVRQRAFRSTVGLDGASATEQQLSNIMINNTIHAGNFRAFRGADLNDGKMEVLLARAGFIPQFLHNLAVLTRTYFYATAAEINARDLTLRLPTPQCLMIDGELWQSVTEVHFEILPGRLQCVA
jgi:diacylglycerol kinase family enzyme